MLVLALFSCSKTTDINPQNSKLQESCIEVYGTVVPMDYIAGELSIDNILLRNNMWGIRGHKIDHFKQCLFIDGERFGWTWKKGNTDPECFAPEGEDCEIACMYQFSFGQLDYGVGPWGIDSGAPDMPVRVDDLESFVVTHDISFEAVDDNPGFPDSIYARHSMVYDLHLSSLKPEPGMNISQSIVDEVIIMMNYNPEYPDLEACSYTQSDPIETNAVFDGFNHYDYHSFSGNVIGEYYHQFRRVGGESNTNLPGKLDLVPFLEYLTTRYNHQNLWLGKVSMGTQLYDNTQGSVAFNSIPTFKPVFK